MPRHMSQQELLTRVVRILDELGIEYMITGSLASSLHGEPRSTHDIDVVVSIMPSDVDALVDSFPRSDYYLDREQAMEAISRQSMFNLIDLREGGKVDFWTLTDEPFDRSRFARKQVEEVLDLSLSVSSPEDTILMKLRWALQSGGSEKQFTDALRVYEVQSDALDVDYLNRWAAELQVEDLWHKLRAAADL